MESLFLRERLFALVIDFLFISVLTMIISSFIDFKMMDIYHISFLDRKWTINYNINFIMMIFYFFIFDFLSKGVSLGKKIMNLEVKKKSDILSLPDRLIRTLLKAVFFFSVFLPITLVYYFIKNEILYDKILSTSVVK